MLRRDRPCADRPEAKQCARHVARESARSKTRAVVSSKQQAGRTPQRTRHQLLWSSCTRIRRSRPVTAANPSAIGRHTTLADALPPYVGTIELACVSSSGAKYLRTHSLTNPKRPAIHPARCGRRDKCGPEGSRRRPAAGVGRLHGMGLLAYRMVPVAPVRRRSGSPAGARACAAQTDGQAHVREQSPKNALLVRRRMHPRPAAVVWGRQGPAWPKSVRSKRANRLPSLSALAECCSKMFGGLRSRCITPAQTNT